MEETLTLRALQMRQPNRSYQFTHPGVWEECIPGRDLFVAGIAGVDERGRLGYVTGGKPQKAESTKCLLFPGRTAFTVELNSRKEFMNKTGLQVYKVQVHLSID